MIYADNMDLKQLERILDPSFMSGCELWSTDELRARRKEAEDLEGVISFARRMVQGRVDIFESYLETGIGSSREDTLLVVENAISEHIAAANSRVAHNDVYVASSLPSASELSALVGLNVDVVPTNVTELKSLLPGYRDAERRLSLYRHKLHEVIDNLRTELVSRYQSGEIDIDEILTQVDDE